MTREDIRSRFLGELQRVIGALFETSASRRSAQTRAEDGFAITIEGSGEAQGQLIVYVDRPGAETLAKAAGGPGLVPSDAVVLEQLKDLCGQVAGALAPGQAHVAFFVAAGAVATAIPAPVDATVTEMVIKGVETVVRVTLAGDLEVVDRAAAGLSGMSEARTLDVILDIDLPLVVRFGRTELPLRTLTMLGPGSVIDLGRAPDDPVEVLISNRVVARGEVVIVAGSYGVRVRDVVSPAERARSLEAELA